MYHFKSYRLLLGFVLLLIVPVFASAQTDSIAQEIARQMDEEMAAEALKEMSIDSIVPVQLPEEEVLEAPDPISQEEDPSISEEDPLAEEEDPMEEAPEIEAEIIEVTDLYGNNEEVGKLIKVNDIGMYYEVYGEGPPLLLIHGNGGDIASMKKQIEHFSVKYKVIVADSRGHGNSEMGAEDLRYEQMAEDWITLVDRLQLDSVSILGWSDGGIIGLLMAINYPERVTKLAAMGANLQPDKKAVYGWAVDWVTKLNSFIEQKIAEEDYSKDWVLIKQQMDLLRTQPNISLEDLKKITAPVLILAGDNDIIREEHSVLMYQNIPNAQLCIFPGETHFIPSTDPALFNMMVERFLDRPFVRPTSKELMFKN